jgi:hypothetical protein
MPTMALPHRRGSDEANLDEQELERRRLQLQKTQGAMDLLDRLMNADDEASQDQREALEYLMHVLHQNRHGAGAPPVYAVLHDQVSLGDDLTEEEILAEQERRLDVVVEALMNVSDEEAEDQRATWEYLRTVLNEDRLSERRRIP